MKKAIVGFCLSFCFIFSCIFLNNLHLSNCLIPDLLYKGMVVIEQNTGRVLDEYNKDTRLPMASTTKIMTALTVLKNCKDIDKEILIDERAVGIEGTSMYLRKGEKLTIKELLSGMLLPSGNDAATALAYSICPTMEEFAHLMNKEAENLGLLNTNFQNSHGLDQEEHYTSAYDLAIISAEAMKYDVFKDIVASANISVRGAGGDQGDIRYLKNKNRLLHSFEGTTGIKTGFTDNAGRCFVSSAKRGNLEIICVVLNCPDMFQVSANLLSKAFENYNYIQLLQPYHYYRKIEVLDGKQEEVKLYTKKGFSYPLSKEECDKITYEYNVPDNLTAPIEKEQVIGSVTIKLNDKVLFEENIYTTEEIKSINIVSNIKEIVNNWN